MFHFKYTIPNTKDTKYAISIKEYTKQNTKCANQNTKYAHY